ncbi:MAG TPA: hypothetical protein PLG61_06605, partial [Methanoregulaceae archaeon]|nr:hypothetical protein [Methanoregulaceae archaeon]
MGVVTAVPPLPCSYSGSVHIGGVPAPEGTVIETVVYTTIRDQVTTTAVGSIYPYISASVTEEEYDNCCQSCGCTIPVEFYINGVKADQTSTFSAGGAKQVGLTVAWAPTPTTTPTT